MNIACENQFLFRPCERDIQYAQIFPARVLLHALCHYIFAHGLTLETKSGVDIVHAHTEIYIHQNTLPHVHLVKLFGESADKANRKFKPFALVNCHNAHHVRILIQNICFSKIHILLLYGLKIPDKVKQSIKTCILKCPRLLQQKPDIGYPLLTARHGPHIGIIGRICNQLLQELLDRCICNLFAVRFNHLQKTF